MARVNITERSSCPHTFPPIQRNLHFSIPEMQREDQARSSAHQHKCRGKKLWKRAFSWHSETEISSECLTFLKKSVKNNFKFPFQKSSDQQSSLHRLHRLEFPEIWGHCSPGQRKTKAKFQQHIFLCTTWWKLLKGGKFSGKCDSSVDGGENQTSRSHQRPSIWSEIYCRPNLSWKSRGNRGKLPRSLEKPKKQNFHSKRHRLSQVFPPAEHKCKQEKRHVSTKQHWQNYVIWSDVPRS